MFAAANAIDTLIVGSGTEVRLPPKALREASVRAVHVVLDVMQTGPAIRTYNIMMGERRRVCGADWWRRERGRRAGGCRAFLRRRGTHMILRAMPRPCSCLQPSARALLAIYAFNVEITRVREQVSQPLPGEIRMQWWTDMLAGAGHGGVEGNPVAAELLLAI